MAGWARRSSAYGIKVAFTPLGITIALIFIGLPFVVRTLQPVIEDLDVQVEEAATSLGASRLGRHAARHPALPLSRPGSPGSRSRSRAPSASTDRWCSSPATCRCETEISPLLIITKLEQYDYAGATAIALVMLLISFTLLLAINGLQHWTSRRLAH